MNDVYMVLQRWKYIGFQYLLSHKLSNVKELVVHDRKAGVQGYHAEQLYYVDDLQEPWMYRPQSISLCLDTHKVKGHMVSISSLTKIIQDSQDGKK
jgi:hypothetical protein